MCASLRLRLRRVAIFQTGLHSSSPIWHSRQVCFILILAVSGMTARPQNTSLTDDSRGAHAQERTRILTFPRRPPTTTTKTSDNDNDHQSAGIVFPDDDDDDSLESFDGGGGGGARVTFEPATRIDAPSPPSRPPPPPAACAGGSGSTTFCEDVPAYPYQLLRDVLSRSKSAAAAGSALFGTDEAPSAEHEEEGIAQRIGEPEESFVCGAVDKTVFPKAGKNKHNKWKYIINQGAKDGYVQGVRVELCTAMGKPCELFGNQPNGYVTACKQKYIYRKMMALSDGGQPIPDTFLMPSACCCAYRRDNRFFARFGSPPVTPIR